LGDTCIDFHRIDILSKNKNYSENYQGGYMKKLLLSIGFILNSFSYADILQNENIPNNTTRAPFNFAENLHKACYNGDIESVQNFLRSGHKVSEIDIEGTTPVHNLFTNITRVRN
jgi:hypothetical protein